MRRFVGRQARGQGLTYSGGTHNRAKGMPTSSGVESPINQLTTRRNFPGSGKGPYRLIKKIRGRSLRSGRDNQKSPQPRHNGIISAKRLSKD